MKKKKKYVKGCVFSSFAKNLRPKYGQKLLDQSNSKKAEGLNAFMGNKFEENKVS